MNKINFTAQDDFPLSSDVMDFLQSMVKLNANLAALGGQTYILSGCVADGAGNISEGIVVIDGEIMPFAGWNSASGAVPAKVTIEQTPITLHAFGVDYPEAQITHIAKLSVSGAYNWPFLPVKSNVELQTMIELIRGDAPGTVKMWAGQIGKIPAEYRLCNGDILPQSKYPELFANIGTSFGTDGGSGFALPDLRSRFVIGYNGADSDYDTIGKTGGQKEVTLTEQQLPAHNHRAVTDGVFNMLSARAADVDASNTPGSIDSQSPEKEYRVGGMTPGQWIQAEIKTVGQGMAHENRPPFFVLAYIIKVI